MKHGLLGLGAYWCIIEMLYESKGYIIRTKYERITFELRSNYELIKSIIEDFGLFEMDEEKFWSTRVILELSLIAEKSKKASTSINKRWDTYRLEKEQNTTVLRSYKKRNTNNSVSVSVISNSNVIEGGMEETKYPFETFWKIYDKKIGLAVCTKKWNSLPEETRALIIAHVPKYVSATPDIKYRKQPATYLNQKTWLDEHLPSHESKKPDPFAVFSDKKPIQK
jgi:uncharacterized protein YdaU (DUF1376 family)